MKNSNEPINDHDSLKKYLVEILGTFTLTFVACWTTITANEFSKDFTSAYLLIALAPALVLFVFLNLGTPAEHSSLNPAITLVLVILKKQNWTEGMKYILLQMAGAVIAAGFIFIELSKPQYDKLAGTNVMGIPVKGSQEYNSAVFFGEFIGSFLLGYTYMSLYSSEQGLKNGKLGTVAVAFVLFLGLLCLNEVFGIGLNPARSVAPAIISGKIGRLQFEQVLGPIVGCLFGMIMQLSIFTTDEESDEDNKHSEDESQKKLKLEGNDLDVELQEK